MSEKTITTIYCDICQNEMNTNEMGVSEYDCQKIKTITVDIWYNGIFSTKHTCSKCSNSIIRHLKTLSSVGKLHTNLWVKK